MVLTVAFVYNFEYVVFFHSTSSLSLLGSTSEAAWRLSSPIPHCFYWIYAGDFLLPLFETWVFIIVFIHSSGIIDRDWIVSVVSQNSYSRIANMLLKKQGVAILSW